MVREEGSMKTDFRGVIRSSDLGKGWGQLCSQIVAINFLFEYYPSLRDVGCLSTRGSHEFFCVYLLVNDKTFRLRVMPTLRPTYAEQLETTNKSNTKWKRVVEM